MSIKQKINALNEELRKGRGFPRASNFHGCYVFTMESFVDSKLVLHGTTLAYGHEIELIFDGVEWINSPAFFEDPCFSYSIENTENGEEFIKVEFSPCETPKVWFVVAKDLEVVYCKNLNKN